MTVGNAAFDRRAGAGWKRGLSPLLSAELRRWFGTRKWLVQILVWAGIINLIVFFASKSEGPGASKGMYELLNVFLALFGGIGVIVQMQEVILGEKRSGTAAWVLSKPASRLGFVLAKLGVNALAILIVIPLVQGLLGALIIHQFAGGRMPLTGILAGLGVQMVYCLFFITFTLMLGVLLNNRAAVIGIPMVFLGFQQMLIDAVPALAKFFPWTLVIPLDGSRGLPLALALMTQNEVLNYQPLISTLVVSFLFVLVGLWRFDRMEL
jgi:ABC-2 type transport system permease protein